MVSAERASHNYLKVAVVVKNPPANAADARDMGLTLGQEDALEEGMATLSSIRVSFERCLLRSFAHF